RDRRRYAPALLVAHEPPRDGLPVAVVGGQVPTDGSRHGVVPISEPEGGDHEVLAAPGQRVGQPQPQRDSPVMLYGGHAALAACRLVFRAEHEKLVGTGGAPVSEPLLMRRIAVRFERELRAEKLPRPEA